METVNHLYKAFLPTNCTLALVHVGYGLTVDELTILA
jgi:hypothetical protein